MKAGLRSNRHPVYPSKNSNFQYHGQKTEEHTPTVASSTSRDLFTRSLLMRCISPILERHISLNSPTHPPTPPPAILYVTRHNSACATRPLCSTQNTHTNPAFAHPTQPNPHSTHTTHTHATLDAWSFPRRGSNTKHDSRNSPQPPDPLPPRRRAGRYRIGRISRQATSPRPCPSLPRPEVLV